MASSDTKLQPWKKIQQWTELGFGQCTTVSSSFQASSLKLKFKGRNTTSWLLEKAGKHVPRLTGTDAFNPVLISDDGLITNTCPMCTDSLDLLRTAEENGPTCVHPA